MGTPNRPHGRDLLSKATPPLFPLGPGVSQAVELPDAVHLVAEADDRVAETGCDHVACKTPGVWVVVSGRAVCGPVLVALLAVRNEILGVNQLASGRVSCHPGDIRVRTTGDPGAHPVGPRRVDIGEDLDAVVGEAGVFPVLSKFRDASRSRVDAVGLRVSGLNQS